jgi:hypothetical protein
VGPDGRIFILDSGWILRVDPDGILREVADLRNSDPTAIAVGPDGGLLVLDSRGIVKPAPARPVVRLARFGFEVVGLVALPDGGAVPVDGWGRRVIEVSPNGALRVVLGPRVYRDFAGRDPVRDRYSFSGLALSRDGLLIERARPCCWRHLPRRPLFPYVASTAGARAGTSQPKWWLCRRALVGSTFPIRGTRACPGLRFACRMATRPRSIP